MSLQSRVNSNLDDLQRSSNTPSQNFALDTEHDGSLQSRINQNLTDHHITSDGVDKLPTIGSTDLNSIDKLSLYKQLRSGESPTGDIAGIPVAALTDDQRQALADQVLQAPSNNTAQRYLDSWTQHAEAGPLSFLPGFSTGTQLATNPADAAVKGVYQSGSYGFNANIGGAIDTIIEGATNPSKIDSLDTLTKMYQANRDIRKTIQMRDAQQYPIASMLGQVGGAFVAPAPAIVASSTATLSKLAQAGKMGAWYGFMYGAGNSNADLTKGEFIPFMKDTATSMGITMLGSVALQGILGSIAQGGRKPFTDIYGHMEPGAGEGAFNAVGSGFGKGPAMGKQYFQKWGSLVDSDASNATQAAQKYGVIDLRQYGIGNADEPLPTGMKGWMQKFNDYFIRPNSDFSYDLAKHQLNKVQQTLDSQTDDILTRAQNNLNRNHDLGQIFGTDNYESAIRNKINNLALGGELDRQGAALLNDFQAKSNTGEMTSLTGLRELKQLLGGAAGFDSASNPIAGSSRDALRGMYFKLDKYLDSAVKEGLPDEFKTYKSGMDDMHNLSFFDHALEAGNLARNAASGSDAGFYQSTAQQGGNILNKLIGGTQKAFNGGGGAMTLLNGLTTMIGSPAGRIGAAALNQPGPLGVLVNKILPSYSNGKINSNQEKVYASYFIDQNNNLSARDKATQKYKLNTDGTFDQSNIPDSLLKS